MTIGGVACETTLVAGSGGSRLVVRTPTIAEILAASGSSTFDFNYYPLTISTPAGAQGDVGGEVVLGPGAPTQAGVGASAGVTLACSERGLCPEARPAFSGAYYSEKCEGWLDAGIDPRRNVTATAGE